MILIETAEGLRIALSAIAANKLRSLLTMLGVIIGTTFVLLMGWFLQGLDNVLENTISVFGTDVINIDRWDWSGRRNKDAVSRPDVTYKDYDRLASVVREAEVITPFTMRWGESIDYRGRSLPGVHIVGVESEYAKAVGAVVNSGRFLLPIEDRYSSNSVVIGHSVVTSLFQGQNPLGKKVKIRGRTFQVVGTLPKRGTMIMDFVDSQIFIPMPAMKSLFGLRGIAIAVKAGGLDKLDLVRQEVRYGMRLVRNLSPEKDDNFALNETEAFREQTDQLRTSVWGIGLGMTTLSFIVGIIGIMNIMFVSVSERTKEIGIRKALGAKRRNIVFQFLIESASLSFLGALISFFFCSAVIAIVTTTVDWASFLPTFIPPQQIVVASLVSITVGVLAGLIPAIRAASLDPVEALRFE